MKKLYFVTLFAVILIFAGSMLAYNKMLKQEDSPVNYGKACTEEAKICPDGSAVGRQGENCEFTPCPGEQPAKP